MAEAVVVKVFVFYFPVCVFICCVYFFPPWPPSCPFAFEKLAVAGTHKVRWLLCGGGEGRIGLAWLGWIGLSQLAQLARPGYAQLGQGSTAPQGRNVSDARGPSET